MRKTNDLKVKNIHMIKQLLQQYRSLTVNANKFFYYSYAKLDVRIQSILKERKETYKDATDIEIVVPLEVTMTYEELSSLLGVNRLTGELIASVVENVTRNSSFVIKEGHITKILFIYDHIIFDDKEKKIRVSFGSDATELFIKIRELSYANIVFEDILNIDNKYQINLYLYACSLLRGKQGKVIVSLNKLREILGKNSSVDDRKFLQRFIRKPALDISKNKSIGIGVKASRKNGNILIEVSKNSVLSDIS